ncbi:MAG: GNAT family N-acetyltransferase [Coprococcus sp.]|nr:GNAT family N-acetyltransferase [Coprococcus sp.]
MGRIRLIRPTKEHEEEVMNYRAEMFEAGSSFDGCAGLEKMESYEEWLNFDGRLKAKYGEDYVPSHVYLAVRLSDGRVVGIIDHRTRLSEFLLNYGGNVGYSIRPSERRKGYAKEMLELLCIICKKEGVERLLITCDKENPASAKTILANGGVLENEVEDVPGLGESGVVQRYWIELSKIKP